MAAAYDAAFAPARRRRRHREKVARWTPAAGASAERDGDLLGLVEDLLDRVESLETQLATARESDDGGLDPEELPSWVD